MVSDQIIDYEKLAREALRSVVRAALEEAPEGLPGAHHFFITVQTGAAGVEVSEGLRAAYPDEITIVIQHQYLDLIIEDDRFAVTLFFANTPERLTVPYSSISRFYDPSVPFGLIFDVDVTGNKQPTVDIEAVPDPDDEEEQSVAEPVQISAEHELSDASSKTEDEEDEEDEEEHIGAKVVSLDQFRKK